MPLQVKFEVYRKGFQFVVTDGRISRLEENEKDVIKKMKEIEGK